MHFEACRSFRNTLLREIPGKIDMLRESIHSFVFNIYIYTYFSILTDTFLLYILFIDSLSLSRTTVKLTFLLNFFIIIIKGVKIKIKIFVYIYKYFAVTLKLTNYAENTSLISLPASFFMIFRGNSCIEAKYRQSTV